MTNRKSNPRTIIIELPSLPPDPQPSEAEIDAVLSIERIAARPDVLRRLARIKWKMAKKEADSDAFRVPFATEVPEYRDYLRSELWFEIRNKVLRSAKGRCAGCGGTATRVHHRDYRPRVLRGEDLSPLVALCEDCHRLVHYLPDGKPRDFWQDQESALYDLVARKSDT